MASRIPICAPLPFPVLLDSLSELSYFLPRTDYRPPSPPRPMTIPTTSFPPVAVPASAGMWFSGVHPQATKADGSKGSQVDSQREK